MIFLTDIGQALRILDNGYDKVELTVWMGEHQNTVAVLEGRLIGGYWVFFSLEEIVRAVMQLNDYSIILVGGVYKRYIGNEYTTEQKSVQTLYKEVAFRTHTVMQTADALVSGHFLTPQKSAVIFDGGSYDLFYYIPSSDSEYTIYYTGRDGSPASYVGVKEPGIGSLTLDYSQRFSLANIVMGNRTFNVYYSPLKAREVFKFRNVFNFEETVSLPASCVVSPKTDCEEAVQGRVRRKYDVEHDVEMTVRTASLPASMYASLLALCRSRVVSRKEQYMAGRTTYTIYRNVIVRDYKLELSDNPGENLSLEMKLAYADMGDNDAVVIE